MTRLDDEGDGAARRLAGFGLMVECVWCLLFRLLHHLTLGLRVVKRKRSSVLKVSVPRQSL